MWPTWLAKTLDRSSIDPRPHAASARRQRVADAEMFRVDEALIGARADDWELATGFRIHLGYGRTQSAEMELGEIEAADTDVADSEV